MLADTSHVSSAAYMDMLKKEHAFENVLFLDAVKAYKTTPTAMWATRIHDIFIDPGSPCAVNIDGATRSKVRWMIRNHNKLSPTARVRVFDEPESLVYSILLHDSFARFSLISFHHTTAVP